MSRSIPTTPHNASSAGTRHAALTQALSERIVLIDGAMGTMIQRHTLDEAAFRGSQFANHSSSLRGANDLLCLTQPQIIRDIHAEYLDAGAEILETNTFNANRIALADYGLEDQSYAINRAAAALAREAADESERLTGKTRWVGGALGPTNRTCSLSPDVNRPGYRNTNFQELAQAYAEATEGLLDGGADILVVETIFDTLNAKAALFGIEQVLAKRGIRMPLMISGTITDASGRTLSGQTPEAFYASLRHADPISIGLNCALGAPEMRQHIQALSRISDLPISAYPNAGLPNELGDYDDTPGSMAEHLHAWAQQGIVNLVGGCCGSSPDHIRAIADAIQGLKPRQLQPSATTTLLSGLEPREIRPDSNFVNIGERCNVTGSSRFQRLIKDGELETALRVARHQVESGAQILDINMDEGLLDSAGHMTEFLNLIASEPDISRVPIMVDSSKWSVLQAGLECIQGKGIVNSISLKEGVEPFLEQARLVRSYGAAVVVMAFDETGQAETAERKVDILSRAFALLTGPDIGFPPQDIIFDPNVFAVATGIEEHAAYGVAFIDATRELKRRFPLTHVSGGVSNLSFSFRGLPEVREAMHSVFLFHAIQAGMDMGIVNPAQISVYGDIDPELRQRCEDVILNSRADAGDRLLEIADQFRGGPTKRVEDLSWREAPVAERMAHSLIRGIDRFIDTDTKQAYEALGSPLAVIEGPLMAGMNQVGDLFGAGQMFLPQVVKSARVMKKAVAWLTPYLEAERATGIGTKGKVLLATVKGDVHDIGKNIVGVVLQCNGYTVIDLGVMVPAQTIIDKAVEHQVDIIGLSGLITPSLDEMVFVAEELTAQGFTLPLLIGGATTSAVHTALRIAPAYEPGVLYVTDASRAVGVASKLLSETDRAELLKHTASEHIRLRILREKQARDKKRAPLAKARVNRLQLDLDHVPSAPKQLGPQILDLDLDALSELIDWGPFFRTWEMAGPYPAILKDPIVGEQASILFQDAKRMMAKIRSQKWLQAKAVFELIPANQDGDDIVLWRSDARQEQRARLPMLRQQNAKRHGQNLCLADFVAPIGTPDWMGAFAVTAGLGIQPHLDRFAADHDDYQALLLKSLADRLAEAAAEWLHRHVRTQAWGYAAQEALKTSALVDEKYQGIRPAPGYPACPDHQAKRALFELLRPTDRVGMELTDGMAMLPAASVSGWYFAHPQAKYFGIGHIGADQVQDYADRMEWSLQQAQRYLSPLIR